jgi:hypothetical protein
MLKKFNEMADANPNPAPGVDFGFTVWEVTGLKHTLPEGDVYPEGEVLAGGWLATHYESGLSTSRYGSISLSPADPDSFTAFKDITKEQAVEWLKAALGEDEVNAIEESMQKEIQKKLAPKLSNSVPW